MLRRDEISFLWNTIIYKALSVSRLSTRKKIWSEIFHSIARNKLINLRRVEIFFFFQFQFYRINKNLTAYTLCLYIIYISNKYIGFAIFVSSNTSNASLAFLFETCEKKLFYSKFKNIEKYIIYLFANCNIFIVRSSIRTSVDEFPHRKVNSPKFLPFLISRWKTLYFSRTDGE